MAKRKRRKAAGPPPAHSPRREALDRPGGARGEAQAPAGRAGAVRDAGHRAPRAAIVAAIFYPYLIYVVGESPGIALVISILAFGLMLPLGILIDRFRYRRQMRKFEEKRAERSPGRR